MPTSNLVCKVFSIYLIWWYESVFMEQSLTSLLCDLNHNSLYRYQWIKLVFVRGKQSAEQRENVWNQWLPIINNTFFPTRFFWQIIITENVGRKNVLDVQVLWIYIQESTQPSCKTIMAPWGKKQAHKFSFIQSLNGRNPLNLLYQNVRKCEWYIPVNSKLGKIQCKMEKSRNKNSKLTALTANASGIRFDKR